MAEVEALRRQNALIQQQAAAHARDRGSGSGSASPQKRSAQTGASGRHHNAAVVGLAATWDAPSSSPKRRAQQADIRADRRASTSDLVEFEAPNSLAYLTAFC